MSKMASSVRCQNSAAHHSHHHSDSKLLNGGKVKKSANASVIPKRFCDFVFRRNVDNRVYRSESFRFIQKTDSFIAGGAGRRSLKVPVIENYIDPVDITYQENNGKEEPSYHEIQERYNAPYYYSDTIKEAPEPPYCSPCPTRKSSYNFSRKANTRGQLVRKSNNSANSNSMGDISLKFRDSSSRSFSKDDKHLSASQVFCRQLLPRNCSPVPFRSSSPVPYRSSSPVQYRSSSPVPYRCPSPVQHRSSSPVPYRSSSPVPYRSSSPVPYRSSSPVQYRSATPVSFRNASPVPYRNSSSPVPYRSSSPMSHRNGSPVPYRSSSPVHLSRKSPTPLRSSSPILFRSVTPVLPRSISTPLKNPDVVDELVEPIKSTSLEDKKRCSSTPPQTQTPRNQFISVCQILNSPCGTLRDDFPITPTTTTTTAPTSSSPPQLTISQEKPRETTSTVMNCSPSSHKNNNHNKNNVSKNPGVPFTHKYLKASVVRDKRLQMLKTSRSISSLDSADSLKSNEEMRSLCGYEPHASSSHSSGNSTTGSSSNSTTGSHKSIGPHTNTVAIAVLDPSTYYHPHCHSPEYQRELSQHDSSSSSTNSSSFLPKLQPVREPDEFYANSRSSWVDPQQQHGPSIYPSRPPLNHHQQLLNDRPESRKTMSVHSCDNSSTCSSNLSLPPNTDHYYTRLLARNSGLGRLEEISYNHHPHSVKVDVPSQYHHSKTNNNKNRDFEPQPSSGYCPMLEIPPNHHNNLQTFIGPDGRSTNETSQNDVNYVRPHRCWSSTSNNNHLNNHPKCKVVSQYQFKVDLPLESQEWFHGAITRLESEKILEATKVGSFLVRNCENSTLNHFSLSIKCKRGFIHIRIEPNPSSGGTFTLAEQEFASVPYLINHFMLNRLPIKGAEHVKLMYPVITQFL